MNIIIADDEPLDIGDDVRSLSGRYARKQIFTRLANRPDYWSLQRRRDVKSHF